MWLYTSTSMNKIILLTAISVAGILAIFLAPTSTFVPTVKAYSCNSSSSASHIAVATQVSGRSGSCATGSSAVNNLHQGTGTASSFGPNGESAAGASGSPSHVEIVISSASGGAQSSCSSSSTVNSGGGATTITQSTSKSGACP
jgi:hypothetical protein